MNRSMEDVPTGRAGAGRARPASLRRGDLTVKFLRAVARLPKGHGIIWRLLVPMSPRPLRRVVADPYGFRLNLDLAQLLDFEYALGTFDWMELEFLLSAMEDESHFIDIGANQGFYSLYVASRNPGVRVLAFEPDPYSLDKLRRNVADNGFSNVTICPYALSDREETGTLVFEEARNRGGGSLLGGRVAAASGAAVVETTCKPLLTALRENGVERISALKIDVEGYEYPVLKAFLDAAPGSLRPKAIVVEALGERIAAAGGSPIELLVTHGYRILNHNRFNFLMELKR